MNGPLEFIHTSKMFKLLAFSSFDRSQITMEAFLLFVSLVAGWNFIFFLTKSGPFQEIRPWDHTEQKDEAARIEELCHEVSSYCFPTYSGSGDQIEGAARLEKLCHEISSYCFTYSWSGTFESRKLGMNYYA